MEMPVATSGRNEEVKEVRRSLGSFQMQREAPEGMTGIYHLEMDVPEGMDGSSQVKLVAKRKPSRKEGAG